MGDLLVYYTIYKWTLYSLKYMYFIGPHYLEIEVLVCGSL